MTSVDTAETSHKRRSGNLEMRKAPESKRFKGSVKEMPAVQLSLSIPSQAAELKGFFKANQPNR
jgi:hypothetical protein